MGDNKEPMVHMGKGRRWNREKDFAQNTCRYKNEMAGVDATMLNPFHRPQRTENQENLPNINWCRILSSSRTLRPRLISFPQQIFTRAIFVMALVPDSATTSSSDLPDPKNRQVFLPLTLTAEIMIDIVTCPSVHMSVNFERNLYRLCGNNADLIPKEKCRPLYR